MAKKKKTPAPVPSLPGYSTVREVADRWGVSKARVHVWITEGEIVGVIRVGTAFLIPTEAKRPDPEASWKHQSTTRKKPRFHRKAVKKSAQSP